MEEYDPWEPEESGKPEEDPFTIAERDSQADDDDIEDNPLLGRRTPKRGKFRFRNSIITSTTGARPKTTYMGVRYQQLPSEDIEMQRMDQLKAEEEASKRVVPRLKSKFPNVNFQNLETYEDDMRNVGVKLFKTGG